MRPPLLLCLFSTLSFGQTAVHSFDLERLSFSPGAQQSLLLDTGKALSKGSLRLSLAAQYQHDPLVYFVDGKRVGSVVESRFSAHLGFAVGVARWLELGLQLPVVLSQTGEDLSAAGIAKVTGTVMGAPLVRAQFSILHQSRGAPVDLGLALGVTLPIGSASGLSKDPGAGFSVLPTVGVGHSFGSTLRLGGELGAVIRETDLLSTYARNPSDEVGSLVTLGAVVSTLGNGLRGELTVRGLVPLSRTQPGLELLAGARYPLAQHRFEIFITAGPGFGRMPGIPNFRALAGFAWTPDFAAQPADAEPPTIR